MPTITENLNSIINTKSELNTILRENGVQPGEVFSDYPQLFREVIATGGGGGDYVTYSYLDNELSYYVLMTYLSSKNYITQATLSSCGYLTSIPSEYITQDELSANGYISSIPSEYITESELSACGYLTSIPSEYITQAELSANGYISSIPSEYITQDELSANSYLTQHQDLSSYASKSYVSDNFLPLNGGVVSGDIVPSYYNPDNDDWVNLGSDSYRFGIYASQIEADGIGAPSMSTDELYTDYIYGNSQDVIGYFGALYLDDIDITTIFPTYAAISSMGYLTAVPNDYPTYIAISNMGYVTTSVNNLNNYYTKTQINNSSYTTKTQVNGMFSYDSATGTLTITTIS